MSDKPIVHVCPYLGLPNDRGSHYAEPADAHRCYSPKKPGAVELAYQEQVCFSSNFVECSRFKELPVVAEPAPVIVAAPASPIQELRPEPGGLFSRGLPLELGLWALAIILAVFAIYSAWPILFPSKKISAVAQSVTSTVAVTATATTTLTPTQAPTDTATTPPTPTPLPTLAPLAIPTAPNDGTTLTIAPDANGTGWVASKELAGHWADRNLHVGLYQDQNYTSILQFSFGGVLPPGSKILFAALELNGRNAAHLGKNGQWQLELVDDNQAKDWIQSAPEDIVSAPALGLIGRPLNASELAVGYTNRFEFGPDQLKLIESQLRYGHITLRLKATNLQGENLFTWDAGVGVGGALTAPTLYLVAVPGAFTVVTNTPTPANVLTAAAYSVQQTVFAREYGTPTPLGPDIVTATPGGGIIQVVPMPTAANAATAYAMSQYATAVALTTGTFTPTPKNIQLVYPTITPVFVGVDQLIPPATPTSSSYNWLSVQLPGYLKNTILFLSTRMGNNQVLVMRPDGTWLGSLTGDYYYQAALSHESYSPDGQRQATYTFDSNGVQQIAIKDFKYGITTPVTTTPIGKISYDAVWSPDNSAIAYVSTESGSDEIYIYDLAAKTSTRLTNSSGLGSPWNKRPSWSPDGKHLVFWSSRSGHPQIYIIDRDGYNLKNISNNGADELNPVWVK
ncbi:MAG: hypothetical protein WCF84_22455 [Anaerolineae bacterium]